jgi:hypothetical protein
LLHLIHLQGVVRWQAAHNVLSYPKQVPDGLLDVTFIRKDSPDPFLVEIETYPDADTLEQVRRDLAMVILTRGVIPDILVLVLLPKGNQRIEPEQIAASAHGLTEVRIKAQVVNLWTVPAEDLLATGDVGLIPWVPLTQFDGPPRVLLEECRNRIEEHARPEEKGNLLAVTRTMVEARYNDLKLVSLFGDQGMSLATALLKLPAGQRLIANKEKDAVRKKSRSIILGLLRKRFGDVPKSIPNQLRAIKSQRKLDILLELVGDCRSLDAFEKAMGSS